MLWILLELYLHAICTLHMQFGMVKWKHEVWRLEFSLKKSICDNLQSHLVKVRKFWLPVMEHGTLYYIVLGPEVRMAQLMACTSLSNAEPKQTNVRLCYIHVVWGYETRNNDIVSVTNCVFQVKWVSILWLSCCLEIVFQTCIIV